METYLLVVEPLAASTAVRTFREETIANTQFRAAVEYYSSADRSTHITLLRFPGGAIVAAEDVVGSRAGDQAWADARYEQPAS
jgi:hypothetical protein